MFIWWLNKSLQLETSWTSMCQVNSLMYYMALANTDFMAIGSIEGLICPLHQESVFIYNRADRHKSLFALPACWSGLPRYGHSCMQTVIWSHRWELGASWEQMWTNYSQRSMTVLPSEVLFLLHFYARANRSPSNIPII